MLEKPTNRELWNNLVENIDHAKKELDKLSETLAIFLNSQKAQTSSGVLDASTAVEKEKKARNLTLIGEKTQETRTGVGELEKVALENAPKSVIGERVGPAVPGGMGGTQGENEDD